MQKKSLARKRNGYERKGVQREKDSLIKKKLQKNQCMNLGLLLGPKRSLFTLKEGPQCVRSGKRMKGHKKGAPCPDT